MKNFILLAFILHFCVRGLASSKEGQLIEHVCYSIALAEHSVSQIHPILLSLDGVSSDKVFHLLNNVCALKGANYLELSYWKGASAIAAAYKNERKLTRLTIVSQWLFFQDAKDEFQEDMRRFLTRPSINVLDCHWSDIDKSHFFKEPVKIFFYNGLAAKKCFHFFDSVFDNPFIAVIDDWNWERMRRETFQAFQELNYKVLFQREFLTEGYEKSSWGNGVFIAVLQR